MAHRWIVCRHGEADSRCCSRCHALFVEIATRKAVVAPQANRIAKIREAGRKRITIIKMAREGATNEAIAAAFDIPLADVPRWLIRGGGRRKGTKYPRRRPDEEIAQFLRRHRKGVNWWKICKEMGWPQSRPGCLMRQAVADGLIVLPKLRKMHQ